MDAEPCDLEARLSWGEDVLAVVHAPLTRGRVVRVAELGLPAFAALDLVVARNDGGRSTLVDPDGAAVEDGLRIVHEALVLELTLVPRGEAMPRTRGDQRLLGGCCGALLVHASFLLLAFLGRAGPGELDEDALVTYRGLASSLDVRGAPDALDAQGGGVASEPSPGERGATAASLATTTGGRARERAPRDHVSDDPRAFGMTGLLASADARLAASPFAGLADQPSDLGGGARGTGFGFLGEQGGLGLSGVGEGGGGRGEGIAIGGEGTLGHGAGVGGCGNCRGESGGRLAGAHVVRSLSYSLCHEPPGREECGGVMVNGRLPAETVQRIVRQSFGRFRACYEDGLVRNPSLAGRIEMKFVIDRSGAVATASASADFVDGAVTSCLTRAYQAMTFPQPEGGIVTVVYPLVFAA